VIAWTTHLIALFFCVEPSKSLPWIPASKTGQPNSFGYNSRGSLQAHPETLVQMPDYMRCNGKRRQPSAAPS